MPRLLHITLTPDGAPTSEAWGFQVDRTAHGGWFTGSLPTAARSALSLARASRRASIVLTLPRAGRFGLRPILYVIRDPQDTDRLRDVDVERLRARHQRARRRQLRGGWWAVLRAGAVARMPAVWTAVPYRNLAVFRWCRLHGCGSFPHVVSSDSPPAKQLLATQLNGYLSP